MAEKYIRIRGKLVAVTEEVYYTYYHMGRQRRTQAEKDSRRRITSYDALDTELWTQTMALALTCWWMWTLPALRMRSIAKVMAEKLHRCLALLPEGERTLLKKIYFSGMSERQTAQSLAIPQKTFHDCKAKALRNLKKMMDK